MFGGQDHIAPFPAYLFPVQSFLRRKRNTAPTATTKDTTTTTTNFLTTNHTSPSYLRCANCALDICKTSQIISKGFTGRHGRAYLVSPSPSSSRSPSPIDTSPNSITSLPNTVAQRAVPRQLVTGAHTVSDIVCQTCNTVLGWKYVAAEEDSQRYKVGNFILETERVCTVACWDSRDDGDGSDGVEGSGDGLTTDDDVEFDSQDEDECEDLFSGTWSPKLAAWRRARKFPPKGKRHAG